MSAPFADSLNFTTIGTVDPAAPAPIGVGVVVRVWMGARVPDVATVAVAVEGAVAVAIEATAVAEVAVVVAPMIPVEVAAIEAVAAGVGMELAVAATVRVVPAVAATVRVAPAVPVALGVKDGDVVGDAAAVAAGVVVVSAPLMAVSANSGRAGRVVTLMTPIEISSATSSKPLR